MRFSGSPAAQRTCKRWTACRPWLLSCAAGAIVLLLGWRGAGALLGFGWAALIADIARTPQLSRHDEGRDVILVGTIDSLPYRFEEGVRFNFAVKQVVGSKVTVPPRAALSWYSGFRDSVQAVGDEKRQYSCVSLAIYAACITSALPV